MSRKTSPGFAILKQIALMPAIGLATLLFLNSTVAVDIKEAAGPSTGTNYMIFSEDQLPVSSSRDADDLVPVPPTAEHLQYFQSRDYMVFIDDRWVNNSILEYYQETDFAHYYVLRTGYDTHPDEKHVSYVIFSDTSVLPEAAGTTI